MASINKLILEKGQENFVHEKEMSKTTSFLFLPLVIQNRSEKSWKYYFSLQILVLNATLCSLCFP